MTLPGMPTPGGARSAAEIPPAASANMATAANDPTLVPRLMIPPVSPVVASRRSRGRLDPARCVTMRVSIGALTRRAMSLALRMSAIDAPLAPLFRTRYRRRTVKYDETAHDGG